MLKTSYGLKWEAPFIFGPPCEKYTLVTKNNPNFHSDVCGEFDCPSTWSLLVYCILTNAKPHFKFVSIYRNALVHRSSELNWSLIEYH